MPVQSYWHLTYINQKSHSDTRVQSHQLAQKLSKTAKTHPWQLAGGSSSPPYSRYCTLYTCVQYIDLCFLFAF